MVELVIIGFVAGIIAGISPCILPVLPVILVAGSRVEGVDGARSSRAARPVLVVAGLVVSFSVLELVGVELLSALDLPKDLLRWIGISVLIIVGVGFLIPRLGDLLERPFAKLGSRQPSGSATGLVLGLALGLLYAPCAGPILSAIITIGANQRVGVTAVFMTVAFAFGTALPLLAVAVAGSEITRRARTLRRRAPQLRMVGGGILVLMGLAIQFNSVSSLDSLQRDAPGYTSALQKSVEGSQTVRTKLSHLTGGTAPAKLLKCNPDATGLIDCGPAPDFTGITTWLNTPGGQPLSLASLRGKVVLVDFWTYSCINCQRALPHVEAWYSRYVPYGLEVVGVHTPEFPFEYVVSNVRSAAASLGVKYPIAVDDKYGTWNAYSNEYWPADYLVDASGNVRHVAFGEGGYGDMEMLIRQLLQAAHPGITLPPPTGVADKTPTDSLSPETYLGYHYEFPYLVPGETVVPDAAAAYALPASLELGQMGFAGQWTVHSEDSVAGAGAGIALGFQADNVYLVLGGTGTVTVTVNGTQEQTVSVSGIPKLYTLFHASKDTQGLMIVKFSPGIQAYDFTFG